MSHKDNNSRNQLQHRIINFDLPDGSNSVSDIQDYFDYTMKNHEKIVDNPPIRIYAKNRKWDNIQNLIIT